MPGVTANLGRGGAETQVHSQEPWKRDGSGFSALSSMPPKKCAASRWLVLSKQINYLLLKIVASGSWWEAGGSSLLPVIPECALAGVQQGQHWASQHGSDVTRVLANLDWVNRLHLKHRPEFYLACCVVLENTMLHILGRHPVAWYQAIHQKCSCCASTCAQQLS